MTPDKEWKEELDDLLDMGYSEYVRTKQQMEMEGKAKEMAELEKSHVGMGYLPAALPAPSSFYTHNHWSMEDESPPPREDHLLNPLPL